MTSSQEIPTGIQRIFAAGNPSIDIDGSDDVRVNADVAILDTGVDFDHPDLVPGERAYCLDANPTDQDPNNDDCVNDVGDDGNGHGTHVGGTVGALDNGFGVVGSGRGAARRVRSAATC